MTDADRLRLDALEDENRRLRAALALHQARRADDTGFLASGEDGERQDLPWPTDEESSRDPASVTAGYGKALRDRNRARSSNEVLTRSDEWLRLAQEAAGIGGFSLDMGSNVLTVSHKFCEIFGLPQREHWTPEDIECMSTSDPTRRPSTVDERGDGTMVLDTEYPILRGDDLQQRWISRRARYVYDETGQRVGLLGTVQDVTDRKRADLRQEAVLRLGDELRVLESPSAVHRLGTEVLGRTLELIRAAYGVLDPAKGCMHVLSEWTRNDETPRLPSEVVVNEEFEPLHEPLRRGSIVAIHDVWSDPRTSDYADQWDAYAIRSALLVPITDRNKLIAVVLLHSGYLRQWTSSDMAFARHAVDRVQAALKRLTSEATLRETELRLRLSLDAAAIGVWDYRPQDGHVWWDRQLKEIASLPDIMQANTLQALLGAFHESYQDGLRDSFAAAVRGENGGRVTIEGRLKGCPADARWVQLTGSRLSTEDGSVRLIGVVRDITADVRAAELLREKADEALTQRKILVDILQCTPDLIAAIGPDFRFLTFNPAYRAEFERHVGVPPRVGATVHEFVQRLPISEASTEIERWSRALAGEAVSSTHALIGSDGIKRNFEQRFTPLYDAQGARQGAVQWSRDVTERTQTELRLIEAEAALRQSQKMEAIGLLTSGIAHDFNNLLHGMVTALSIIKRQLAKQGGGSLERYADMATSAAHRAAALTHRLLAFSRQQPLDPKPLDTNLLVSSMEDLFLRTSDSSIKLAVTLAPDLWLTRCDANQLENALLNLVVNARDAMPQGGMLCISTANAQIAADDVAPKAELEPGDYVRLTVADAGVGMTPDILAHAFDPFFTTKPRGQGTGLGLSMIYGFVKQSGGHIHVDTTPGQGTAIDVYLPRYIGRAAPERDQESTASPAAAGNGYVVQVVEDDDVIRALTVETLQAAGYRVFQAPDGMAGLAAVRAADQLDALVTDVGLPGMNGRQLADAARLDRPNLPVLFMTGYAESAVITSETLGPAMEMIIKPFSMDLLLERVGALIAQSIKPSTEA
ncbi:PAS domain-containing protein [Pigmentiphaga aceris]|uniref:histidine kinase n=1 Tax=Pigmentiphaga aceris TaxID=1940612 RepID=A0A5C0AWY1_9BURK|nr:PAS domain-containing protein [Pigmentiphaga aceris]QEI06685.1 PAS domain-containing protein [Pigmentiphaga aceris]